MATSTSVENEKTPNIPFDSLTLRAVVAELRPRLIGGQVQDIRQPQPDEIHLGLRSQGKNYLLLLSADSRAARVHLTGKRRPNAPTPPTFCMTLRKHLENGIVRDVRQRGFDRILELDVETRDESGEPVGFTLIAELMGKHSNLILVNAKGFIQDAAKRITHKVNRLREVLPGRAYLSPPEQTDRLDPFAPHAVEVASREAADSTTMNTSALTELLMRAYAGMSPFLGRELAMRALAKGTASAGLRAAWEEVFGAIRQETFAPILIRDTNGKPNGAYPIPLVQVPADRQEAEELINFGLDTAFSALVERSRLDALTGEVRGKIEREIKRLEKQRRSVERTLEESERAEEHKQSAELILANLRQIQTGMTSISVQDYYDPEQRERVIALDPRLSPQENAEAWFKRYRKARDAEERAMEAGTEAEYDLERLREAKQRLTSLTTEEAVRALRTELLEEGLLRPQYEPDEDDRAGGKRPDFQGHKIRRYMTDGYEIYVGETATANDYLTNRLAAPNDIWLHVRAAASAHVLIRSKGKPEFVPRAVLERAALLCALHSAQKHASLIPVDYTLKKFVRKPRGSRPGAADYQRETTLHISP